MPREMSLSNNRGGVVNKKTPLIDLLTLLIMIEAISAAAPDEPVCRGTPGGHTALGFTDGQPGNLKFACPGGIQTVRMHCCMQGYTHIEWYEFLTYKQQWHRFFTNEYTRVLREHNQTIAIFGALKQRDGTNFSCVGHGAERNEIIHNNFTLRFENCDAKGPSKYLWPEQKKKTIDVALGSEAHLSCHVYFGNQQCTSGCNMWWTKQRPVAGMKNETDVILITNNQSERIWFSEEIGIQTDAGGFGETTMHIRSVSADDLKWSYVCGASSVEDDAGRTFLLTKAHGVDTTLQTTIIVACAAFFAIMVITLGLGYAYNVEIRVFIKMKLRSKKPVKDKDHDVFLLYNADADEHFAENILGTYMTDDLKYKVLSQRTSNYGQAVFSNYSNAMDSSKVMVVAVTKSLLQEAECKLCIREAISTGRRTIYVIKDDFQRGNDYPEEDRDILVAASLSKVTWCGDRSTGRQHKIICGHKETVNSCKKRLHLKLLTLLEDDGASKTGCIMCRSSSSHHELLNEDHTVPNHAHV